MYGLKGIGIKKGLGQKKDFLERNSDKSWSSDPKIVPSSTALILTACRSWSDLVDIFWFRTARKTSITPSFIIHTVPFTSGPPPSTAKILRANLQENYVQHDSLVPTGSILYPPFLILLTSYLYPFNNKHNLTLSRNNSHILVYKLLKISIVILQ